MSGFQNKKLTNKKGQNPHIRLPNQPQKNSPPILRVQQTDEINYVSNFCVRCHPKTTKNYIMQCNKEYCGHLRIGDLEIRLACRLSKGKTKLKTVLQRFPLHCLEKGKTQIKSVLQRDKMKRALLELQTYDCERRLHNVLLFPRLMPSERDPRPNEFSRP